MESHPAQQARRRRKDLVVATANRDRSRPTDLPISANAKCQMEDLRHPHSRSRSQGHALAGEPQGYQSTFWDPALGANPASRSRRLDKTADCARRQDSIRIDTCARRASTWSPCVTRVPSKFVEWGERRMRDSPVAGYSAKDPS